ISAPTNFRSSSRPREESDLASFNQDSGRSRLPPLLETFATEDGAPLGRPEGDRSLLATLRADRSRFNLGEALSRHMMWRRPQHRDAFCLAGFAPFGFVFELFVVKEQLFSGREDEVGPAVDALQYFVL